MPVLLGAIADDFTGATDLASVWARQGVRVLQVVGTEPRNLDLSDVDAVVVALKTRTISSAHAVSQSVAALKWLRTLGIRQFVFKYCSTFDSTPKGNIGPVTDALMDELNCQFAVVCPALPENGRTVYKGILFVGDVLLAESSMKDHPLTPMRESSVVKLMESQSRGRVGLIPWQIVSAGEVPTRNRIDELRTKGFRYGVADAIDNGNLLTLGRALTDSILITGGSGIAMGLPQNFQSSGRSSGDTLPSMPQIQGRSVVLAGSCSDATRGQISHAASLWESYQIDVDRIAAGVDVVSEIVDWANLNNDGRPILIYGSDNPTEVAAKQAKYGKEKAGEMVEHALASIAVRLSSCGFRRFVVAGGETSGAVTSALGIDVLQIGPEVAPGVPWCRSDRAGEPVAICLKSGNFGGPNLFIRAMEMFE